MIHASTRILSAVLLAGLLAGTSVAHAAGETDGEQISEAARKLIAVKVTGTTRFSQEDILAASGLQLGVIAGDEDFKKAARRLGDSGAFSDVGYSFSYSGAGTKLEFQVVEADKFLPAHFEDFVWFSEEDMRKRLKQHVPLFHGELPNSGRLRDEVSDVLQAMLVEVGVPGIVNYTRFSPTGGPAESVVYSVANVIIRVRNVEFTGAGEGELAQLQSAAQRLPDRQYSRTRFSALVEKQFLPVFHAKGYLKASFGPPQPSVVKEPLEEGAGLPKNLTLVDIKLEAHPGQQYKLSRLEWAGNKAIPTETLQPMVRARVGEPANTVQLANNLGSVKTLYGSKGYVAASIKTEADFDDAASTVALRVNINEDSVYHMGDLEFRGVDNSLTAKLRSLWKIRAGEVYDATYINDFLPEARHMLPATLDWESSPHVTANVRDKTVDVDIIYSAKAPK